MEKKRARGGTPMDRRAREAARGERSGAVAWDKLRGRLIAEIDPDRTMDPAERERRVAEAEAAHRKRQGQRGGVRRGELAQPPATVTTKRPDRKPGGSLAVNGLLWERHEAQNVLAVHDMSAVYRMVIDQGYTQSQIARATRQSTSEVSEILSGRVVRTYELLTRIARALNIPPQLMGLSWDGGSWAPQGAHPGRVTVTDPGGVERMLRRHLFAVAGISAFGFAVPDFGELIEDGPPLPPAPSGGRIGTTDVGMIRDWSAQVRDLARLHGGESRAAVALAGWADQWLDADATDKVRAELLSALTEAHAGAGWCCHDSAAVSRAYWHFSRAVELATDADDPYAAAHALRLVAVMLTGRGRPDQGLKVAQMATLRLGEADRADERVPVLRSWCHAVAALALSRLGGEPSESIRQQVRDELARARDGWSPPGAHAKADMDLFTALTWMHLGELDRAEGMAEAAVRTFGDLRREGVVAEMTLAQVHLRAGDGGALERARLALIAVRRTRTAIARQCWLPGMVSALEARPGGQARELAEEARQLVGSDFA